MRKVALTIFAGLLLLATVSAAAGSVPAKKHEVPKDACALLTADQVAPLVPSATAKATEPSKQEVGWSWRDEEATDISTALNSLNVTVTKLPIATAELKFLLKAESKDPNHHAVKRLGDFALQANVIPPNSEVKVLLGNLLLDVEFSGSHPVTDEERAEVLALARMLATKI